MQFISKAANLIDSFNRAADNVRSMMGQSGGGGMVGAIGAMG